MQKRISDHIRSNVVGYVALFFALSGGAAWATHPGGANTISTADIQNQAVTNAKLEDVTIRENKIRGSAVTTPKLATGAVITGKLADLAVTGPKLAGNSVDSTKVVNNSLTADDLNGLEFLRARTARLNDAPGGSTAGQALFTIGRVSLGAGCQNSGNGNVFGGIFVGTSEAGPVLVTDGEGGAADQALRLQTEDVQFIVTMNTAGANGTPTSAHAEEKSFAILDNGSTSASGVAGVTVTPTGNCVITVHAIG